MASKFALAGAVSERRIRPIWDAINLRQFNGALKQCTALLSKYPNSPQTLALKALILERMGEKEEALTVCLNAKEILFTCDPNILVDDHTLKTLQLVFQRLDHSEMATSCYEHACCKHPNNLELMIGLFHCYVREYSFLKQQQIAVKLYKIAREERFLLWAVCSVYLQVSTRLKFFFRAPMVSCGNGEEKLFLLAEGLLKKHITSHGLHEPEALSVYVALLEDQQKFGEALEILSGELGSLMVIGVDKLRLQGRLLARLGNYASASDAFRRVLEICPDDWDCFLQYFGSLLEDGSFFAKRTDAMHPEKYTERQNLLLSEETFDSRISNAMNFVDKLMAKAEYSFERCPYLAYLEIERCKLLFGKGDTGRLVDGLVQYFMRFGHLACFTSDIKMLIEVLDQDKKSVFLKKLIQLREDGMSSPTKAVGQSISVFKIQNMIDNMLTFPLHDLEDRAVQMTEMFWKTILQSKELDAQMSVYGDKLLSLTRNILVQLFRRTRNLGYLLESILLVEFGLTIRRHVVQYKTSLVRLYSYWNCLPLAYECYKSLDVKNILEMISHHVLSQMLASPLWTELSDLLRDCTKLMNDHFRESANLTSLAYHNKNYSQAIRYVHLKERFQHSSQYAMVKIEAPILQIKQNSDNIEAVKGILESLGCGIRFLELSNEIMSKPLAFYEDLKTGPWWTPIYDKNQHLGTSEGASNCPTENRTNFTEQLKAATLKTIEKRSLLSRMIYLSLHSASESMKQIMETNVSIVEPKISIELEVLLERYAIILEHPFQDAVGLVIGVSSGQKAFQELGSRVIDWITFAVFLNAWNLSSHEIKLSNGDPSSSSTWHLVNSLLKNCVQEKITSSVPIVSSPGTDLPFLVQLLTEPLAWHGLIIQSCIRSVLSLEKTIKKGGSGDKSNSKLRSEIQNSIQSVYETVELVVVWLREQIGQSDDEKFEAMFSLIRRDERREGPGNVFEILESYVSLMKNAELGHGIGEPLRAWSSAAVMRKIITGQGTLLSEFLRICESKMKSMQELLQCPIFVEE